MPRADKGACVGGEDELSIGIEEVEASPGRRRGRTSREGEGKRAKKEARLGEAWGRGEGKGREGGGGEERRREGRAREQGKAEGGRQSTA